jgi:dethiobiotin synthetase
VKGGAQGHQDPLVAFVVLCFLHAMRFIVTSIGTGEGKTWFSRGFARSFARRGVCVAALKPFETGVGESAQDARALEFASGVQEGSFEAPEFFRARAAVSPLGAVLLGEPGPDLVGIGAAIRRIGSTVEVAIVESAGGLFVPLGTGPGGLRLFVELVEKEDALLVVARNRLGVLSHVLALQRAVQGVAGEFLRVVLVAPEEPDESTSTNAAILREAGLAVFEMRRSTGALDDLADAVEESGAVDGLVNVS